MGRSIFFEKKLKIQFYEVFDFESNDGILDPLALLGAELWRFENLKFVLQLQLTQKNFTLLIETRKSPKKFFA